MKRKFPLILVMLFSIGAMAQNNTPWQLYNASGEQVQFNELFNSVDTADVILFGELHNNPVAHWAQIKLLKYLHTTKGEVALGMEMLETDNQLMIDEYAAGYFAADKFEQAARLWPNYSTDYKPMVDYAIDNNLSVVATNIPRRYANMVSKQGFEVLQQLSVNAKSYIAPLPILYDASLPGYQKMLKMMQGGPMGKRANENFPKAQAVKDATMAHFILQHLPNNGAFLHLNGTYHSDNYEGIFWYLKKNTPNVKIVTIATRTQSDLSRLNKENEQVADFILVVDEDLTGSY